MHLSHTIRQESLQAYYHEGNQKKFGNQAMTIFRLLRNYPEGFTRNEISKLLNIKINAVCGRVNELIQAEWLIEDGKKLDEYSNMRTNIVRLKNE